MSGATEILKRSQLFSGERKRKQKKNNSRTYLVNEQDIYIGIKQGDTSSEI